MRRFSVSLFLLIFCAQSLAMPMYHDSVDQPRYGCLERVVKRLSTTKFWMKLCDIVESVSYAASKSDYAKTPVVFRVASPIGVLSAAVRPRRNATVTRNMLLRTGAILIASCLLLNGMVLAYRSENFVRSESLQDQRNFDRLDPASYDVCHKRPQDYHIFQDESYQCCKIYHADLVECCRFNTVIQLIACTDIELDGVPAHTDYEFTSDGNINPLTIDDANTTAVCLPSLHRITDSQAGREQIELWQEVEAWQQNHDLYSSAPQVLHKFFWHIVSQANLYGVRLVLDFNYVATADRMSGCDYLEHCRPYVSIPVTYFKHMPLSRIRWTMAHEARHLKQQDRTFDCASKPCQKLLQLTQNDIRLVFQENRETDADIGGTLIIEDGYAGAEALWHSYLLDPSNSIATKKEQRERESFCIRYDHTTCDKEAFIRRNGAYPLNHPPYVSCRIPRMLEAAEKYKEADAKLKKEIKEKFAHAQQNNFE